jgi:formylglycine-generating enzyme required for sulfatase activity
MHLFISHATKDSGREALALAEALEAQGHVCWIAPRDVRPGIPYPRQIVEALEQCSGLVLLLSPAANDSADVLQEVQLAAQAKKTIAPVVLAGTAPGADLRYYVSVRHQIAWSGGEETALRLAQTFPAPVSSPVSEGGGREAIVGGNDTSPLSQSAARPDSSPVNWGAKLPRSALGAGALALIVLLTVLIWSPWRDTSSPLAGKGGRDAAADTSSLRDGQSFRDCDFCPEMVMIPGGSFMMGSPSSESGREGHEMESTRTSVQSFAAGRFEVTFDEWSACAAQGGCASNPAPSDEGWGRGRRPVVNISWDDAQEYVRWLSEKTGRAYRLMSEAEWEYAARAGSIGMYSWGNDQPQCSSDVPNGANFWWCPEHRTRPVGEFQPNAFGLFDVHGNAWEWVTECFDPHCALRGGAWDNDPEGIRVATRLGNPPTSRYPTFGLRVARAL